MAIESHFIDANNMNARIAFMRQAMLESVKDAFDDDADIRAFHFRQVHHYFDLWREIATHNLYIDKCAFDSMMDRGYIQDILTDDAIPNDYNEMRQYIFDMMNGAHELNAADLFEGRL